ncbi:bifunctional alpha/beta hydrolase/class I SAM-dependent methyltransferase [Acinetobacter puyangensis]|uniref:Lysophospholipase, alpha-beta hydrolase superfamily n=1 Tax=Acinetobacter puyangensis TaxID=1096779 RepID=A0A240EDJ0_9GAMM|nr:bifunctional alpha/beta hydrolase/class I SAM-dependent methyltransferase [Acinetobacter puyangensis]SNX45975.1 Lysophospholipase, alpha-beta hydrolase superfamily [Acinetobacter puyangensis]
MYQNTQHTFNSHDGIALFYQHWQTDRASDTDKKAIVMLHRGHEHSGRMAHLVEELQLAEFDFFAWDARGHGQSPGERGDAPSFSACVKDIQYFVQHIQDKYQIKAENIAVIGQSVGAVLAATWVHDYAPQIRALCLASPAFDIKLYVPFARAGLTALNKLRGNFFISSYVKAAMLTHDVERAQQYDNDPQIGKAISVRMLLGLYAAADRVVADAQNIFVPTQVVCSGSDFVVERKPQQQFYEKLPHPKKEWHVLEGFYHDTLGEKDRHLALEKIRRFILANFAESFQSPQLLDADKIGASCAIAEEISTPLPKNSIKHAFWQLTKANLKLGSKFSKGLKIGEQTGYDSGSTLDFVYRDQLESSNPIGKLIDWQYLQAIGWRGIRVRKQNLEALLKKYAVHIQAQGKDVRILDIAAGHGRYILDAVAHLQQPPASILLRDYSALNVEAGQQLIRQRQLEHLAQFQQGDAFDTASLAAIQPRPNLAVVSGLYELFADNTLLNQSLTGLAQAIPQGGYLIYTGQIWHPQQEFIARALTSHRQGQAWVMRLRSQAEIDALVEHAGFKKIDQCIDEFGIFTVSVAQRL